MQRLAPALTGYCILAMMSHGASAADADAVTTKPIAPSLGEVLESSGVQVHGYMDTAYSYLSGDGVFTSAVNDRVFDTEPSSFNLHQAALTIGYQPKEGFGGLVNFTAGRDARIIKSVGNTTDSFDVTQAFVQYARGSLTLIGGKYVTLAGAEVINSTADFNYSRSILFGYAIPFAHTGIRATYAASDKLNFILGVNNGWDQLKDQNRQKTVEVGVGYTPSRQLALAAQAYSGIEQVYGVVGGIGGNRNLVDIVGTYNATDRLSLILNYDYGTQDHVTSLVNGSTIKASWSGTAAYLNFQANDLWRISLRGEYLDDSDGYKTGVIHKWKEATLSFAYLPAKAVELRTEIRTDSSDASSFVKDLNSGSIQKHQYSLGLEAIFKF